jgi:hypothetical protein
VPKALVAHLPHLLFVAIGVVAYFWAARREPRGTPRPRTVAPRRATRRDSAPAPVHRSVARRGLLALAPLVCAALTGGLVYGINLAGQQPGSIVTWIHTGISILAVVLVARKLSRLGGQRLRAGLTLMSAPEFLSILLAVLLVPLLASGLLLLLAPSSASFVTYSHLVASAWWTGLLMTHLWRYLRPSLLQVLPARPRAAVGDRPAPAERR